MYFIFIDTGLSHRLGLKIDDELLSTQLTTDVKVMLLNGNISTTTKELLLPAQQILLTIAQQRTCTLRVLNHKPHSTMNLRLIQIARGLTNRTTQICAQLMECMTSVGDELMSLRRCSISFGDLLADLQINQIGLWFSLLLVTLLFTAAPKTQLHTLLMYVHDECCQMKSYLCRHVDIVKCMNQDIGDDIVQPPICDDDREIW